MPHGRRECLCFRQRGGESVICPAAANQTSFIAALNALKQHFAKCGTDEAYCEDLAAAVAVREQCTQLAGDEQYESFFSSMIGA